MTLNEFRELKVGDSVEVIDEAVVRDHGGKVKIGDICIVTSIYEPYIRILGKRTGTTYNCFNRVKTTIDPYTTV